MLVTTTAGTWGITGAQFLWGFGALCVATAAGVWLAYRRALGPPAGPMDPLPDLGVCEIGLLNEGPDCATTAAAARLYYDGLVRGENGTLAATGELDVAADPIEREVFQIVRREPTLPIDQLRDRVADSDTMRVLREQMTRAGLLLDEPQARLVRRLWIVPALVTALGVLRIVAGLAEGRPILWLAVMTGVAGAATLSLATLRPGGTRRGHDMLERLRAERGDRTSLLGQASAGQIALAAALYGAGTLWLAESAIASALGVPREEDPSVGSGGGGGCGGCGDGGGGGCGGCGCGG